MTIDRPEMMGRDVERECLESCLAELLNGPGRFIQLRGRDLSAADIRPVEQLRQHDVDLLGSEASIRQLLETALTWVQRGFCHVWYRCQTSGKRELTLFSPDVRYCLRFDLWVEVPQLDQQRQFFTFADCEPHIRSSVSAVSRLVRPLECGLYLQHLICKRRDLRDEQVQQRLDEYGAAFRAENRPDLEHLVDLFRRQQPGGGDADHQSLALVASLIRPHRRRRGPLHLCDSLRKRLLRSPRRPAAAFVFGCDGTGKTTLMERIKQLSTAQVSVQTGKHLYRKSWLYKLAVILLRPMISKSREQFDEQVALWAYCRASAALRWLLVTRRFSRRFLIIDRSLTDFLMLGRKTDQPHLHPAVKVTESCGCRLPAIHCIVSHETLHARKQEITAAGHQLYDRLMFEHFTGRVPTDYVLFANERDEQTSAAALWRLLRQICPR